MLAVNARGMSKNDPTLKYVKRCCDQVSAASQHAQDSSLTLHQLSAVLPVQGICI
jgi:hypothetical protein